MEEQILEFLDGNLSGADEEELLHRLAVSPERRMLLRQHLQVREMVGVLARKQKLAVPGALTAGVFSSVASLGYSGPMPPVTNSNAGLKPPIASAQRTPGLRKRTVALLALACLLLGSGVTYLLDRPSESSVSTGSMSAMTIPSVASNQQPVAPQSIQSQLATAASTTPSSIIPASTIDSKATRHISNKHISTATTNINNGSQDFSQLLPVKEPATATPNPQPPTPELKNATPAQQQVSPKNEPAVQPTQDIREPNTTTSQRPASPFDVKEAEHKGLTSPYSFSVRSGGGKMPGSTYGYTGSLFELRGTYHLNNWLSVTGSYGQFMPYETGVVSAQIVSKDASQYMKLASDIQYKNVAGIELGASFAIEEIPFEISAGTMNDFQGTWIPRASLFTSLDWSDALQLKVGIEGMFYTHHINFSNTQTQPTFLLGTMKQQETAGFVGPAIELNWKF